jgi:hypothetical protein
VTRGYNGGERKRRPSACHLSGSAATRSYCRGIDLFGVAPSNREPQRQWSTPGGTLQRVPGAGLLCARVKLLSPIVSASLMRIARAQLCPCVLRYWPSMGQMVTASAAPICWLIAAAITRNTATCGTDPRWWREIRLMPSGFGRAPSRVSDRLSATRSPAHGRTRWAPVDHQRSARAPIVCRGPAGLSRCRRAGCRARSPHLLAPRRPVPTDTPARS